MKKWPWIIYGLLLTNLTFTSTWSILDQNSSFHTYYTILTGLDKRYYIFLILGITNILVNLAAPLVVFLYCFNVKSSTKFWKAFFFIRIGFDLFGHFYDSQFIKAAFFQSLPYGLACLSALTLPILPSYIAHYQYTFKKPS
jgi:hypothetical protein